MPQSYLIIVTGLTYLNSKNGNGIVVRREARDATYSSEHEIKKILGNGAHGGSPSEFIKKNLHAYETADRLQHFDITFSISYLVFY